MSDQNGDLNLDKGHIGEPQPSPYGARATYPSAPSAPYGGYAAPAVQTPTNQAAILALVFGILGFALLGIFGAIPAVILGNKAKRELALSNESGQAFATTGLMLGWIQIGLTALVVVFGLLVITAGLAAHSY